MVESGCKQYQTQSDITSSHGDPQIHALYASPSSQAAIFGQTNPLASLIAWPILGTTEHHGEPFFPPKEWTHVDISAINIHKPSNSPSHTSTKLTQATVTKSQLNHHETTIFYHHEIGLFWSQAPRPNGSRALVT